MKEEKIKEIQEKIKEKIKYPEKHYYVSEEELAVQEERVLDLERETEEIDRVFNEKMRQLEIERKIKQREADNKLVSVKDLEKV